MFDVSRIPEQFRLALEANYELELKYVPKIYPGPVTLFRARTRPLVDGNPSDLGWGNLAGGGLEITYGNGRMMFGGQRQRSPPFSPPGSLPTPPQPEGRNN